MALDLMCCYESVLKFESQYANSQMWKPEGLQRISDLIVNVTWIPSPKGPHYTPDDLGARIFLIGSEN